MLRKLFYFLLFFAILSLATIPFDLAVAQETQKEKVERREDGWRFLIAPYVWLTAIQGDAEGKRGNKVDINVDLGDAIDLLSELEFAFMSRIEIENGRWGFIFDGAYLKLEGSEDIVTTRDTKFPIIVPPTVTIQGGVEITSEMSIIQAALSYDVYRSTKLVGKKPELTIEAMAGARYNYFRTRVEFEAAGPLIGVQRTIDKSKNWIDPIIGGRLLWRPHEDWELTFEADVGGFGAGADFSSNLNAGLTHRITDWLVVNGGYRGLYNNYDKNDFKLDAWIHGPWIGIGFVF